MKHTTCLAVNELHKTIEVNADHAIDTLQKLEDKLTQEYWRLHDQVAKTSFGGDANQFQTLSYIGELAIAIKTLTDAKAKFQGI